MKTSIFASALLHVVYSSSEEIKDKFSFSPPYLEDLYHMTNYDFGGNKIILMSGSTVIQSDTNIMLTTGMKSQAGYIWSKEKFDMGKGFEVEIDYRIHGVDHVFGDGFAFWFTPDKYEKGKFCN
jgi:mannose-binding lectin 2